MLDYEILRSTGAGIFNVLAKAKALEREGKKILHFEIGQPDFNTPEHVKDAAKQALDDNFTGYVASSGIQELKLQIQEEVLKTRGFKPSLNQIIVLPGANPGIYYALRSIVERPGEDIIYPDPGFPTYGAVVHYLQAGNKALSLKEKNEFRMNPNDVENLVTANTKAVIINSPQNPTGSVMKSEEIDRIAELSEKHGFYILTDEIYSKMTYDEKFHTPSIHDQCKERTIILDGVSKSYSMTGWRLGWAIAPELIVDRIGLLISMGVSCTTSFVQKGGIAALKGPQDSIKSNMEAFRNRRDTIVKGLNQVKGFSCLKPEGAFYVFPNITQTGFSSQECADHMLKNGVCGLPGTIFGPSGEGYLRFSYATSIEVIKEGIEKLKSIF